MKNLTLIVKLIGVAVIIAEEAFDGQPGVGPAKLDLAIKTLREGLASSNVKLLDGISDEFLKSAVAIIVSVFNQLGIFSKGK